jgi:hypothetical protein
MLHWFVMILLVSILVMGWYSYKSFIPDVPYEMIMNQRVIMEDIHEDSIVPYKAAGDKWVRKFIELY